MKRRTVPVDADIERARLAVSDAIEAVAAAMKQHEDHDVVYDALTTTDQILGTAIYGLAGANSAIVDSHGRKRHAA